MENTMTKDVEILVQNCGKKFTTKTGVKWIQWGNMDALDEISGIQNNKEGVKETR